MGLRKRTKRGRGAWAEVWCRDHLGMVPLNRTATAKGAYHPDGKIGNYLVSVKSSAGKSLTVHLHDWRDHAVAAYSEARLPLLVLVLDQMNPVALVAGHPAELLRMVSLPDD